MAKWPATRQGRSQATLTEVSLWLCENPMIDAFLITFFSDSCLNHYIPSLMWLSWVLLLCDLLYFPCMGVPLGNHENVGGCRRRRPRLLQHEGFASIEDDGSDFSWTEMQGSKAGSGLFKWMSTVVSSSYSAVSRVRSCDIGGGLLVTSEDRYSLQSKVSLFRGRVPDTRTPVRWSGSFQKCIAFKLCQFIDRYSLCCINKHPWSTLLLNTV